MQSALHRLTRSRALKGMGIAVAVLIALSASALDLVKDGHAVAAIVIPDEPSAVASYAAQELQYHIEAATGARLPIVEERQEITNNVRVYLGQTVAVSKAKVRFSYFPVNSYRINVTGPNIYIVSGESPGDPLDLDTSEGTLFAIYDFLENNLGVRWLWPGKLGEVIPHTNTVSFTMTNAIVQPLLWFKQWRNSGSRIERIWLKRQRFGRSIQPQYGHSFGNYWTHFGSSHPEYFAMLPDGTRRLDPTADPGPEWVHMCVSSAGLTEQILADWKERGSPRFLNVCENDGWAGCACPTCLSWDEPDPDNPVPFNQRLEAAKKTFEGKDGRPDDWLFKLGSLSDRYARFWKIVSEKARQERPDVEVVSYIYDNYRKPPVKAMLNSNVLCGLVPQESIFGYSERDSEVFRHDWTGWEKTGCGLFLRPNYTLQQPNFPAFYARTLGEDLKFAMAHGLKGTDFDSLTGKFSTEGPSLYMLAKMLNHPDASTDAVINEFCAAFGLASATVKQYFLLWESVYPNFSESEKASHIDAKRKYGCGIYGPFYFLADEIYTPTVMSNARSLLAQAHREAASDGTATARVAWLFKGLEHADLILATEKAWEHKIDSHDDTEFTTALQKLDDFRKENADYDKANCAGLTGSEKKWHPRNKSEY